LRERLIFKLAVFAGLRPGEIFALRRERLSENTADIRERIYRGKLDTPKTQRSIRVVALSASVREDLGMVGGIPKELRRVVVSFGNFGYATFERQRVSPVYQATARNGWTWMGRFSF
jgi:integrase